MDQVSTSLDRPARRIWSGVALGALGAVVGLAPWLVASVGGARLPLQNLWASQTLPDDMPWALLPLSQYYVTAILALLLTGALLAGLVLRWWGRPRGIGPGPVLGGMVGVHAVAVGQSFWVLADGLGLRSGSPDGRAALYFGGMLGGTIGVMVGAVIVLVLTSRSAPSAVAVGVTLAAVPVASWLPLWFGSIGASWAVPVAVSVSVRFLPAVAVGVVIGWCAWRTRPSVWIVTGLACLVLLALVPPLLTSLSYGLGMRVLNGDLVEMAAAARDVFPLVLREQGPPVLGAVLVGVVTWALCAWLSRRSVDVGADVGADAGAPSRG